MKAIRRSGAPSVLQLAECSPGNMFVAGRNVEKAEAFSQRTGH
jgi:hypothetical protein